jgi:hypothetical protein
LNNPNRNDRPLLTLNFERGRIMTHYKSINTIFNNANLETIEKRIERIPTDTIIRCSKGALQSQDEKTVKCTLMLLNKYGIKYIFD